ncbi:conserved hypothetical protein [Talaromyces stipitatus ATCC 10500]|uniref:Mucin-7 n=1 Tax=Talaromyces stipitatus (strain ATCC 10500 / CBS 375.48 / QM 6759 / NRRL 1006) TaxID=441959 RepID=B8MGT4_TALSN|nr:uncharacterized protein TSTA_014120 [Talaromyces stipitatus ATCC 10500]XP_002483550.1 uncharacterized protein TSTA_014120 [Talaromyces stipitatus ATCC 10500]EED16315.1 conserved hypothetical protein [Talaromyces stipitatus ATCC 10500]EED16316.1 conserved hypothetical protein [Talaromyces stipitatus ATCC 10500]
MTALPASGGVRSLLAKFENTNNNSNNPDVSPSRGRSSVDSQDNATNRPLSKVRASFVSVERNGQGSPTPGVLRRAESYNSADVDSNHRSATVSPTGQLETASASPFNPSPHKIRTALATFQGDRIENANAKLASLVAKDNAHPPPKVTEKSETTPELLQPAIIEKPVDKPTNAASTKQTAPSKTIKKSASTLSIAKESSQNKNPTRAPTVKERKPAVTPTRSATTTTRPAAHSDKPASRSTAARSSTPATRAERASTPSHDITKRPPVQPSPKTKPASKSPTRPVRLPASLVTPTAASAARTGTLARSQSHVNLRSSPKTEAAKTLSRKPSTLRPDTSRLATHTIPDRPKSRVSTTSSRAPQEESFLARMMRPTASSASKMHDKVEPRSPPRLGKAAKLTPKKETPTKTAEVKKEMHEKPLQDPTPATPKAKIEKVAPDQTTIKEDDALENGHHVAQSATLAKDEFPKEAGVSTAQSTSDSIMTEKAPETTAEPSSELAEESKTKVTAAEPSPEPVTEQNIHKEAVQELETQATQADDVNDIPGKDLESVPETVPEVPENDVKETAQGTAAESDSSHDNQPETIAEPVLEAPVPLEGIWNKTDDVPEDQDVKHAEPEQPTEKSVPAAAEETPAEPVEKAEEPVQNTSVDKSLESTAEKTEEKVEYVPEDDN